MKRKGQPKSVVPRGSIASYGTSDDDVFLEPVSPTKPFGSRIILMDFSPPPSQTQRTAPQRYPTAPAVSRPLKDTDVKEGQPIQLTCQVQGFPKSEVGSFTYI